MKNKENKIKKLQDEIKGMKYKNKEFINCQNCNIVSKESFHGVCRIKDYVRGYILKGIYSDDNNDKEIS